MKGEVKAVAIICQNLQILALMQHHHLPWHHLNQYIYLAEYVGSDILQQLCKGMLLCRLLALQAHGTRWHDVSLQHRVLLSEMSHRCAGSFVMSRRCGMPSVICQPHPSGVGGFWKAQNAFFLMFYSLIASCAGWDSFFCPFSQKDQYRSYLFCGQHFRLLCITCTQRSHLLQ